MRKHLRVGALFAWMLSTSCGARMDEGTDGATHWLTCKVDAECKSGTCSSGVCEGEEAPRVSSQPQVKADAAAAASTQASPPNMGQACIPGDEYTTGFAGFSEGQVGLAPDTQCPTQLCLVHQFRGRVTCPYGQSGADDTTCTVAGGTAPVTVPVHPQFAEQRPENSVYCSCRCDGPDASASYCDCDPGFECQPLVPLAVAGREDAVGSYCVKQTPVLPIDDVMHPCDSATSSCGAASDFTPEALGIEPVDGVPVLATLVSFEPLLWEDDTLCLSHPLPLANSADSSLGVACRMFETQPSGTGCDGLARMALPDSEVAEVRLEAQRRSHCGSDEECGALQVCELTQLTAAGNSDDYASCLNDIAIAGNGWCYVDLDLGLGTDATTACSAETGRKVRFAGGGIPQDGSRAYLLCAGQE
jgi:hypothetical protein